MPDDPSSSGPPTPASPAGPPTLTRAEARRRSHRASRRRWYAAGGAVLVVIAAAVVVGVVSAHRTPDVAKAATPPSTTVAAKAPGATCPLTGTPAPGGVVPARPALAAKIGNYSGDRPSAGLDQADVVFEEPVEGAITRLVAVFQCHEAPLVGDLRSAREPDVGILSQLSHPLFAHAGGIDPVLALLQAAPLTDEDVLAGASSVVTHPSGRVAPYSTFTSTSSVWALDPSDTTPPAPIFQYSATPPKEAVAGTGVSVHIPFSSSSDVTWSWDPKTGTYLRSYSGQPDTLIDGTQNSATNVVVMTVQTYSGPWVENSEGALEVEVTATGSGPLVVLRDGAEITGTWSRSSLTQPATLTASDGSPITLRPGTTWEELVPSGIPVTVTPGATAPGGSPAS